MRARGVRRLRGPLVPAFAAACVAFVLLAVACDDAGGSKASTAATVTPGAPAASATPGGDGGQSGSEACAPARTHQPGASSETLSFEGVEREYRLHVPASYEGDQTVPLVFNLHGLGSDADEQDRYSQLPAKADEEGFILVTPEGQGPIGFWNIAAGSVDVRFLGGLLDRVGEQLCIDPARVYATGMSNGAFMSSRLACDLADRFAAIAPVAGVWFPEDCAPARSVAVLAFHGEEDRIIPFEGGPVGIEALRSFILDPVRDAVAAWAARDGCGSGTQEESVSEHVTLVQYGGCKDGIAVELYAVEGGGHTWPGAPVDVPSLGATTREITATDLLWEFFAAHPMPR